MVAGGDSFEIDVPGGRFYLYYRYGTNWNEETENLKGETVYYRYWKSLEFQVPSSGDNEPIMSAEPGAKLSLEEWETTRNSANESCGNLTIGVGLTPELDSDSGFIEISQNEFPQ